MNQLRFFIIILSIPLFINTALAQSDATIDNPSKPSEVTILDPSSLIESLRTAAEKGEADAQYSLGNIYQQGLGVDVSYIKAAFWYKKAADQGLAKAQNNLALSIIKKQLIKILP